MLPFHYQPHKITVGVVYHYLKTNLDGTKPEHISIRVASPTRIESFKFHPGWEPAALVSAEMDWEIFSAVDLESWQTFVTDPKKLAATLRYLPASQAVEVAVPAMGQGPEEMAIPRLPFHIYNFDLASLNFALRHLRDPQAPFTVGLVDPSFKPEGPAFIYRGEVEVVYVGEEQRQGVACRKYRIDGPGLDHKGGYIWADKAGEFFRDIEIELPDNPNWETFKFALYKIDQMDTAAWEAFRRKQMDDEALPK